MRDPDNVPAPSAIEPRRLQIYSDLIFNNVEGFISGAFPILRRLYDEESWQQLIRDFLVGHQCHSPYFLEISQEFLTWLREERELQSGDPAFMLELAHYEWVELALDVSPETFDGYVTTDNLLEGFPRVSPLAWPLSYQYPVHRLGPDYQPQCAPEQPTFLIVYRNRRDEVAFMESNAVTVRLLELLSANTSDGQQTVTGRQTLLQLAAEIQHPAPEQLVGFGANILEMLQKCDILC